MASSLSFSRAKGETSVSIQQALETEGVRHAAGGGIVRSTAAACNGSKARNWIGPTLEPTLGCWSWRWRDVRARTTQFADLGEHVIQAAHPVCDHTDVEVCVVETPDT